MPENVVYILGAGFSQPLGIPIMSNFLERSKDMFASKPSTYAYFEDVFSTIREFSYSKNYYNTDLFNIEEILSILEMQDHLNSRSSETSFKKYIIDTIKYYTPDIRNISIGTGDWLSSIFGGSSPDRDYGMFISTLLNFELHVKQKRPKHDVNMKVLPEYNYSIITVNYDSVIEDYCSLIERNTNLNNIDKKLLGFNNDEYNDSILAYAKLHGSVLTENIIPPTWNKNIQNDYIKSNWKLAYRLLSEANHIRIIGYSIPTTDTYIKFLLKSSVINSTNLKKIDVICLDDNKYTIYNRYKEFVDFKNFRFQSANVVDYLKLISKGAQILTTYPGTGLKDKTTSIAMLANLEHNHDIFMSPN